MSESSPFDHRRDPELGRLLRAVLSGENDAVFVQRVLAAAPLAQEQAPWWHILTTWARPGLVAAGLLAAAAAVWSVTGFQAENGAGLLGDPLPAAGAGAVPGYLVVADVPDIDAMMVVVTENE